MSCLFQAKVGRDKEFQVALRKLRGKDADITREAAEIQVISDDYSLYTYSCLFFLSSLYFTKSKVLCSV